MTLLPRGFFFGDKIFGTRVFGENALVFFAVLLQDDEELDHAGVEIPGKYPRRIGAGQHIVNINVTHRVNTGLLKIFLRLLKFLISVRRLIQHQRTTGK